MIGEVEVTVEIEAQLMEIFRCCYGLVEAR